MQSPEHDGAGRDAEASKARRPAPPRPAPRHPDAGVRQQRATVEATMLEADPTIVADALVLRWATALDGLDYFTLLRLPLPRTTEANAAALPARTEVRAAFHEFALAFHPDRHRGSEPPVRQAAARVFRTGVEAYGVLQDPLLGPAYARLLRRGQLRMSPEEVRQVLRGAGPTERAVDVVRSPSARAFAQRADELRDAGDLRQARLQMQLACARDPDNARLRGMLAALEETLPLTRPPPRP